MEFGYNGVIIRSEEIVEFGKSGAVGVITRPLDTSIIDTVSIYGGKDVGTDGVAIQSVVVALLKMNSSSVAVPVGPPSTMPITLVLEGWASIPLLRGSEGLAIGVSKVVLMTVDEIRHRVRDRVLDTDKVDALLEAGLQVPSTAARTGVKDDSAQDVRVQRSENERNSLHLQAPGKISPVVAVAILSPSHTQNLGSGIHRLRKLMLYKLANELCQNLLDITMILKTYCADWQPAQLLSNFLSTDLINCKYHKSRDCIQ